jgi:hypothetical protein
MMKYKVGGGTAFHHFINKQCNIADTNRFTTRSMNVHYNMCVVNSTLFTCEVFKNYWSSIRNANKRYFVKT